MLPMIHFLLQARAVDERQVRSPQDMRWIGELLQRSERVGRRGAGDLVVKRSERRHYAGEIFSAPVAFHHGDSFSEKRHGAAAVGDDEANIGAALERAGINQINDGAGSVEDIFDGERRRLQARVLRRFAVGRMDEHDGFAPVELVENRIERWIAQVTVVDAGKKPDAVKVQDVKRIGQFFQRAVNVRQGKKSEGAESRGVFEQHPRLEFIAYAGDVTQPMEIVQDDARRERSYGGTNMPTIHGAQLRFGTRQLDRHGFVGVLGRHHVVMHVDAPIIWCILAHTLSLAAKAI